MSDIQVRGPKGCAKTLSFGGETFTADKKGIFTVPIEAADHLRRHGFSVEGEDDAAPASDAADQVAAEVAAAVEAVEAERAAGAAQS